MKAENKKKTKNSIKFATVAGILSISAFIAQQLRADNSISQIDQSNGSNISDETQEKIEELQKRAEVYRQIIDIKKKQGETLNSQLEITNTNIDQVQSQIKATQQQIDDYNSQILRLNVQIKEKTELIESQKKLLSELIQSYYQSSITNPLSAYLNQGDFGQIFTVSGHLSQTGDKIKELVDSVTQIKQTLLAQSAEIDQKKGAIVEANQKLQSQSDNLQSVKDQRQALLTQTKGEEAKYAQLLQRVEQQKQELLNIDELASASGLSLDSFPKPPASLYAPLSWFYSQKDSRWANNTIGNSNSTLKAYGCAVAAIAMVFTEHGNNITPAELAKQPIFSWDLISWPKSWPAAKLTLSGEGMSHGNIDWSIIDKQLAKNNPVIVYIGRTQGSGGHYVVIHHKESSTGKYVVHDPYFGPNLYLETSRALVGAMGGQSGTVVNQMIIYN